MILHYKVDNKKEKLEISVEDFLKMTPEELSAFDLTRIKASRDEMNKIKEHTGQYKEQYATLQQKYGLETSTSPNKNLFKKDHVEDYIENFSNASIFSQYDSHAEQLRTDLASQQQEEFRALNEKIASRLEKEETEHTHKVWALEDKIEGLEATLEKQENKLASLDGQIEAKKRQLAELQTQQQKYEAELQQYITPERLAKAYKTEIQETFYNSIRDTRDKIIEYEMGKSTRKLWVTNGAPLDKYGKPIIKFDQTGKVIGTPADYAFPALKDYPGPYGVDYCALSAVSCIKYVDKKCGATVFDSDEFKYIKETLVDGKLVEKECTYQPYISGRETYKGSGEWRGTTDELRADTLATRLGNEGIFVSGCKVNEERLIIRDDGKLAVDIYDKNKKYTVKASRALDMSGVSLKDICQQGNLITDEKTGEKYYACEYNGVIEYVKDGDILSIKTGPGSNTSSGFHMMMINIDQNTGAITYTAGNREHAKESAFMNDRCKYYTSPVGISHISEFAQAKISSFDEQTRIQMAKNLGLCDDMTYQNKTAEIEQVQAELEALQAQRKSLSNDIEQTETKIYNCQSKISDEKNNFNKIYSSILHEEEKNEKALEEKQSNEKEDLEEKIKSGAMRLLSGEKIEDIINSMPSYPHAQTQDNINPSERVLEGDYWFLNLKDEMKKERGFFDQVIDNILRRSEESEKNQQQPQEEDEFFAVNSVNRNLLQKGRDIC